MRCIQCGITDMYIYFIVLYQAVCVSLRTTYLWGGVPYVVCVGMFSMWERL